MNYWEALRWKALRDVYFTAKDLEGADSNYQWRKIFRWYSAKFSTPLHVVETLPLEDVCRAWFEDQYEGMEEEELESLLRQMAISPVHQADLDRQEDRRAMEDWEYEETARRENAQVEAETKKLEDVVLPVERALEGLLRQMRKEGPEAALPSTKPKSLQGALQPDIKMTFISDEEFQAELDRDERETLGLFDDPRKRK